MRKSEIQNGIGRSWRLVLDLDLGETISSPAPLGVNAEFRDIALSAESSYVQVYRAGLRLSHYNFLLSDLSFFQFSHAGDDELRFAYYPNPFISSANVARVGLLKDLRFALQAEEIDSEEYLQILSELRPEIRAPSIRYEFAPKAYREFSHPCSHLHIGHHADNRWALNRMLGPLAFTLLILKHYYRVEWDSHWKVVGDKRENDLEIRLIAERANCPQIDLAYFSPSEARSFAFY
jgi:hypothetical protein